MKKTIFASLVALTLSAPALAQSIAREGETAVEFTANSGDSVAAFQGSFQVPEFRADPESRMIELGYVRFPATTQTPGSPIVYLAGGPGGSGTGTAEARRFPLFMAMRQHGDVIAFDQRGTGLSQTAPACRSSVNTPDDTVFDDSEIADAYRRMATECRVFWENTGADVRGYTTAESVSDLQALQSHLQAERISLWSISYGSHLALAAINAMDDDLDRVIIASAEGLDQTVKLPARTDAYFARVQAAVDSQPEAAALYPDVAGLMRRVQARLDNSPVHIDIPQQDGSTAPYLLQRRTVQEFSSRLISDPDNIGLLLAIYASLDADDYRLTTALLQRFHTPNEPISARMMPLAMDMASGISAERLALFEAQVSASLIGGYLNFPMPQLLGVWDDIDLGDAFRVGPTGETPVLLFTGTLDGRTYPDAHVEAVAGLSDVTHVIVRNAGHNLFMVSDAVPEAMHQFMRAEAVTADEITIDLPDFSTHPFAGR